MTSIPSRLWLPLAISLAVLSLSVSAQFRDDFDTLQRDPSGMTGWHFQTGDGVATMEVRQGGEGYASIFVDATQDKRGIWWALFERKVSPCLDLKRLREPGMRLRLEARIRVSHAPRRVNLQLFVQSTTNYHSHLMEYDIPDTNRWHVISWTPPDLEVQPGDQVTAHMALMDWGLERYRVDVDYIKVDVVDRATAGPDAGMPVPYHPPIPDPIKFTQHLPVSEDCTIDLDNPEVNLNDWSAPAERGRACLLAVGGSQDAILRWDLRPFAGRRAGGNGLLELTTRSVEHKAEAVKDFGLVRVVEIAGGDPAWEQETVTGQSFCRGKPVAEVMNPQPIIDWPVAEGDGAKNYFTISRPVLQRLMDGETRGIAIKPLGAVHAAFYSMENDAGKQSARLLFNLEETGYEAWLRYDRAENGARQRLQRAVPATVVALGQSEILKAAQSELIRGAMGMLDRTQRGEPSLPDGDAIVLGTFRQVERQVPGFDAPADLPEDSWCLRTVRPGAHRILVVAAPNDRGVLYGVFALLRKIALQEKLDRLNEQESPYAPIRMINQWDNLDGSIERGYAGKSIFWEDDHVTGNLERVGDYARLLASVGLNGCAINNVNADARVVTAPYLQELERVAQAFRPWGVRLFVSIDFSSPKKIGGLDTFDPLDPRVAAFWKGKVDEIYGRIPDFGGFVLKADSEGRLGPSAYGRTHADAANVIARALKPHGGILFYRGFVYDHHMDWRNPKNDRARAAYDNFQALDGEFDYNALVQIKHGPIDFQVREPVSPLFGALPETSQAIELQITQEYTGQQRHLCYFVPMWKEVLDFDMQVDGPGTPVKALVCGKGSRVGRWGERPREQVLPHVSAREDARPTEARPTGHHDGAQPQPLGGFVAVANVGRDTNWLGHPLAMANLYGFGRLAWNPDLSSKQIVREWTAQTFGHDRRVIDTITDLQLASWRVYEQYTGPLGAGGLTDITGVHFGPGIESSERNSWGQWHRADERGIGMDRTEATGTGFIGQYSPPVARMYESLKTCPDELLLFFHHVPYTHVLHSGKTVIQHIYDSHYAGAAEAADFVRRWKTLKGRVDERRYDEVLARLEYQAGHAVVWRDAICQWFLKTSGIEDRRGRAGHYPNRIEAENMHLDGCEIVDVKPWETASGGKAVQCANTHGGSARFRYEGKPGRFDLIVQYFDESDGRASFALFVGRQKIEQWLAADDLPSAVPNGHTSTRRTAQGVRLRPGDEIRIESAPDGGEKACVDYVEILRSTP